MKKKVAIILGTRPEIIKMSPVIRELRRQKISHFIIHTNQHYSQKMDAIFFRELEIAPAKYNLDVGSGIHGLQTGKMLPRIEEVLLKEKPSCVLVHGDTNTTLSGALAAKKLHLKIGHVEAGLRSFDEKMPEEVNRVLTDHMTDFCFAPTKTASLNLRKEGINSKKIIITGNTIVEAVKQNKIIADKKSKILSKLKLENKKFALLTFHRPENTDSKKNLENIIKGLSIVNKKLNLEIIFPAHPRTQKMIDKFKLKIPAGIKIIEPVGYFDFLTLIASAQLIFTDSGGIQEEACILKVPCVTLRGNTERPETIAVGSNVLVGSDVQKILSAARKMLLKKKNWHNPFGNESVSKIIIQKSVC